MCLAANDVLIINNRDESQADAALSIIIEAKKVIEMNKSFIYVEDTGESWS